MKIEGPSKSSGAKGVSKSEKKKTGDGSFDALIDETEESAGQSPVTRSAPVGALDALLTLQGADSSTSEEAAKKAKKRAADLLDHLDRIKMGLLVGEIPIATLQQLSRTIATHRESVMDPKLAEILDDIDLRAQVELAKLER